MSKIKTTIWEMEPHTEAKHAILRKYLDAWLPIITRYNSRVLYVDGFAGPGAYIGGKDGSPIIAIKAIVEHRAEIKTEVVMKFIEDNKERCEYLKQKISTMTIPSNIHIECICGKFEDYMKDVIAYLEEQKKTLAPSFFFIDPFGFTGIPFDVISKIMQYPKCEVLITFMYEEINRFIGIEALWNSLENTFGTDKWKDALKSADPSERMRILHAIYLSQLKHKAGIEYVNSFKMKNKSNRTDYFLFFGTNNILGLKKMKEAMWKIDKTGTFQFSDATYNPDQPTLFELGPNYAELKGILVDNLKGKIIGINELEDFVVAKTSFRETHFKRQILLPMEKATPKEIEVDSPNPKRRIGTFDNCRIKFV